MEGRYGRDMGNRGSRFKGSRFNVQGWKKLMAYS
jgi:hypothetical protein